MMRGLVMSMVSNPIDALLKGNYIGIPVWAIGLGFALRHGNETTKTRSTICRMPLPLW